MNLIKAIVRANKWFAMLRDREVKSISDLAKKERVSRTYLSRLVPLALLAPDITETILEGRQPVDLSTERLFSLMPLPLSWVEQRSVLGFSAR